MPNKNYLRGVVVERKAKEELEQRGYTVFRCAGSHGIFDLIAFSTKDKRLVQCKRTKNKNTNYKKEIEQIRNFKNYPSIPKAYKEGKTTDQIAIPTILFIPKIHKELWVWTDRKGFDICSIGN